MRIEEYNRLHAKNGLRCGYTTGTCAAAAAKAALMIWAGIEIEEVRVLTPAGVLLDIPVQEAQRGELHASCAVRKYAGDDPDITDQILIYAKVEIGEEEKESPFVAGLEGGKGIGRVSRPGLDRKPGEAAINSVPRRMIEEHVKEAAEKLGIRREIRVRISAPEGEDLAKKTLNPKLGIIGGISILGTGGLVLPMSRQAIIDTIKTEMRMQADHSSCIIAVPGNYGLDFIKKEYKIEGERSVGFSNYIGETIDYATELRVEKLLLIGHIGKFVKLAGGIMNTHSNEADARAEIMAAHLLRTKPEAVSEEKIYKTAMEILASNTSTEAVEILKEKNLLCPVMGSLAEAMYRSAKARSERAIALRSKLKKNEESDEMAYRLKIGVITYTPEEGELARAGYVEEILEEIGNEKGKE
ncbi:MAG: cobalt-precorrin-5B (C(1))-methyltransferase CbiD [Johnsonella sp.]|nr:cobalt-precorrin-5B (C(1))-methyltransferase CbiD [Johnsonella sp.]